MCGPHGVPQDLDMFTHGIANAREIKVHHKAGLYPGCLGNSLSKTLPISKREHLR